MRALVSLIHIKFEILRFAEADPPADALEAHFGASNTWQAGVTVPDVTEKLITDAWNWYLGLKEQDPMLIKGTYVLLEMMQKVGLAGLKIRDWS